MDILKEANKPVIVDPVGGLKKCIYLFSYMMEEPIRFVESPNYLIFRNICLEVAMGHRVISSDSVDKILWNSEYFVASEIEDMQREILEIDLRAWLDYLKDFLGDGFYVYCGEFFTNVD